MAISTPGVGSGLDVNGIVSKLMDVEAQPLVTLQKKKFPTNRSCRLSDH